CELQIAHLLRCGSDAGGNAQAGCVQRQVVRCLRQPATTNSLEIKRVCAVTHGNFEDAHVFLGSQQFQSFGGVVRSQQHFQELGADRLCCCQIDRTVEGDDAAERRGRVSLECLLIGRQGVVRDRNTARIGVFDDDAGSFLEAAYAFPGSICIGDVVVGQFFALQLNVVAQQASTTGGVDVEGCCLV